MSHHPPPPSTAQTKPNTSDTASSRNNLQFSRGERGRRFGIDCVDSLMWKAGRWEPGGEYVKKLIIKNVSVNTIKVKYELPGTKFFSMEFPQLLTLSPGTFVALDVIFRPIRLEAYDDFVTFRTEAGKFTVRVCSRISHLEVQTPPSIDFGFCPVGEVSKRTLLIRNTGQKTATFSLDNGKPFDLFPMSGTIEPGKEMPITVSYNPTDATVFVASIVCYVPGLVPLITKISGIGKYPYISASDSRLDYGTVIYRSGKVHNVMHEKEFELRNQSFVPATFEIVPGRDSKGYPVFSFKPNRGTIPPESHLVIKVRYKPVAPRSYSCDRFKIITPGGNDVEITCTGQSMGPAIVLARKEAPSRSNGAGKSEKEEDGTSSTAIVKPKLSRPTSLQFGDVKIGQVTSRVIYLTNNSELPVPFQFVVEDKGTFLFNRTAGVIPPKLQTHVTLVFEPKVSGNFYRRIFCLFKDQLPLCIDCIGTGYADLSRRPPPLTLAQVDAHRRRQRAGKGHLSPMELEELLQTDQRWFDLTKVDVSPCGGHPQRLSRSGEATELELGIVSQFFENQCGAGQEVSIEQDLLDFGPCLRTRHPEPKTVRVYNRTNAKVTCMWRVPESDDDDDEADFLVIPDIADIPAHGSYVFKVAFLPTQNDFYYNQEIEAYIFFKSNRNFRLVNERTLTPPWCLTIPVFGHTFGAASSQFLPRISTSLLGRNNQVHFPACYVNDSVYQTFQVTNESDTPSTYKIEQDPSGIFTIKPTVGVISPGEFILVAVKFSPKEAVSYRSYASLVMNNSASEATKIELVGLGNAIDVSFENGGALYFKPTSTGIVTHRSFKMKNKSRVPIVYKWDMPSNLEGAVSFSPMSGRMAGNEEVVLDCSFAPKRVGLFHSKISMYIRPLGGTKSQHMTERRLLNIIAEGRTGAVKFEPESMDMGTTLVGSEVDKTLTLSNTSDADLHFRLDSILADDLDLLDADHDGNISAAELRAYSKQRNISADKDAGDGDGRTTVEEVKKQQQVVMLGFEPTLGLLPARSKLKVKVTYRPSYPTTNRFQIFCDVVIAGQDDTGVWDQSQRVAALSPRSKAKLEEEEVEGEPLMCSLIGRATYPTLRIVDARSALISPAMLWKQFSLSEMNYEFSTPLTTAQLRLNQQTGVGSGALDYLYQNFLWEFTPRPAGSPSEVVLLRFKNVSKLPLEFSFKMPNELDVEIEHWADAGEPTEDELRQNSIIDARLFEIEPKQAQLPEGETVTVRISYNYNSIEYGGDHCVPVLFKMSKGKQIRLWLRGRTLPPDQARLFVPVANAVKLNQVPIGHASPPIQNIVIQNPSSCTIEYNVNLNALKDIQADNFNFPIFKQFDVESGSDNIVIDEENGNLSLNGFVESGSTAIVPFVFQPLEEKKYELKVPITYRGANGEPCAIGVAVGTGVSVPSTSNEAVLDVTIVGRGFHPAPIEEAVNEDEARGLTNVDKEVALDLDSKEHLERIKVAASRAHDREQQAMEASKVAEKKRGNALVEMENEIFGPPIQQELLWEGMIAKLSVDRLSFGIVPAGCVTYAVTTIRNTAPVNLNMFLEFAWDTLETLSNVINVYPRNGRIPPGENVVCKFTLQSTTEEKPKIIDQNIRCFLNGIVESNNKRRGKGGRGVGSRRSTTSRSRARSVRSSTNNSPTGSISGMSRSSVVNRTTMASRGGIGESLASMGSVQGGSRGGFRPGTGSTGNGRSASRISRMTGASGRGGMVDDNEQGASSILFLNLTGEIANRKTFRDMNRQTGSMDKFFTPRLLSSTSSVQTDGAVLNTKINDDGNVKALAKDIVSALMDDLIADPSIEHLMKSIPAPPPPYFVQLSGSETPRLTGAPIIKEVVGEGGDDELVDEIENARKQTLQDNESQSLISKIMENTIFNLVQDVAVGDLDLANIEKRFVCVEKDE